MMKEELLKIKGVYYYSDNFVKIQIGGRTLTIDCSDGFSRLDDLLLTKSSNTEDMLLLVKLLLKNND